MADLLHLVSLANLQKCYDQHPVFCFESKLGLPWLRKFLPFYLLFPSIFFDFLHLNCGEPQVRGHCLPWLQEKGYVLNLFSCPFVVQLGAIPTSFSNLTNNFTVHNTVEPSLYTHMNFSSRSGCNQVSLEVAWAQPQSPQEEWKSAGVFSVAYGPVLPLQTLKPTSDGVHTFQMSCIIKSFCSGSKLVSFYSTSSWVVITVVTIVAI